MKRRTRFRFTIGTKKLSDKEYTIADIQDWFKKFGVKVKVLSCSLTGFQSFTRTSGFIKHESLGSTLGRKYSQVAGIEVLAYDKELIEVLLRGLNAEILEEGLVPFPLEGY